MRIKYSLERGGPRANNIIFAVWGGTTLDQRIERGFSAPYKRKPYVLRGYNLAIEIA